MCCCGVLSAFPLRSLVASVCWKTVAVSEWGFWAVRWQSATENPATAQCIWLSFHCPQASFELTHMQFVYSHLTAADSNIWLVCVALPYLLYPVSSSGWTTFIIIVIILESDMSYSMCVFEVKDIDKALNAFTGSKYIHLVLKSKLSLPCFNFWFKWSGLRIFKGKCCVVFTQWNCWLVIRH